MERWERKLRELTEVSAPSSMDARVEDGPHGTQSDLPSTSRRVLVGVVAFALFLPVVAFGWRAFQTSPSPDGDPTDQGTPGHSPTSTHVDAAPRIAFTDAQGRIALMRPDGSGVREITTGREPDAYHSRYGLPQDIDPQWGVAGSAADQSVHQRIYFVRRYTKSLYSLCSVSPSGTGFRVVIRRFPASSFALSPDGFRIAYGSGDGIYVAGNEGSDLHRIARILLPAGVPITWSPREQLIAFASESQELWTVDTRTGELTRVTPPGLHVDAVAWDPVDPSTIAIGVLSDFSADAASSQVWTIRPDGTGMRRVTTDGNNLTVAAWSPGGARLLLGRVDLHLRDDGLAVIDADGSGLEIVNATAWSGFGSWGA